MINFIVLYNENIGEKDNSGHIFVSIWYFNHWRPLINNFDLKQILGSDRGSSLIRIKMEAGVEERGVPLKSNYSSWQIKLLKICSSQDVCILK